MAYWIVKAGNSQNSAWRSFQCDYITDISKLPTTTKQGVKQENDTVSSYTCSPGSQCLCQEDGSIWLLGKDTDKWIKRSSSGVSNGDGGTTEEDIEPISDSQIESLFT